MFNEVIRLTADQKDRAVEVLTAAFHTDPAYMFLFPDEAERARSLRRLWEGVIKHCLRYGEIDATSTIDGVACWLIPGRTETTMWQMLRTGMALPRAVMRFNPPARKQFLTALNNMEETRKQLLVKRPHWYLWALGVAPRCQGQGIGSKLIEPVLPRADAEQTPCYLEALTEKNVAFYQKRGFAIVHESKLPGWGVNVRAMLREPR